MIKLSTLLIFYNFFRTWIWRLYASYQEHEKKKIDTLIVCMSSGLVMILLPEKCPATCCQDDTAENHWFGIWDFASSNIFSWFLTHRLPCPVGWVCRINRLHLCRVVRPPPQTSVLDMTLNNLMVCSSNAGALGNAEYPFIAIAPRSTLARCGSTW